MMLADPRGELRVAAASSEEAGLLELFQLQNDEGPCLECFRTGRAVTATEGKLAERLSIDMDRAFAMLRDYARNSTILVREIRRLSFGR